MSIRILTLGTARAASECPWMMYWVSQECFLFSNILEVQIPSHASLLLPMLFPLLVQLVNPSHSGSALGPPPADALFHIRAPPQCSQVPCAKLFNASS